MAETENRARRLRPITVRRAMIWVVLVSLILAGAKLGAQSRIYQGRATKHAELARLHREHIKRVSQADTRVLEAARLAELKKQPFDLRRVDISGSASEREIETYRREHIEVAERSARYHTRQRDRYEQAASRPWLPVPPDDSPR